ncbi:uncharacterized protein LOC131857548 [Cryptomeria japonica]|uniref:uncharacterized protein LOC131857548 n=1 Tax=Cryptomeria japonica TaxID=3369 RepID=UPI0027DA9087|nr:uncharacterized protein LOC131857548 [Cryptomeria japonica]
MEKLVSENSKDWHKKLYEALWADRTTPKRTIGMSPFELVYGVGAQLSLPLELAASKLQTVVEDVYFQDALEKRVMYLAKIEEEREKLVDHCVIAQGLTEEENHNEDCEPTVNVLSSDPNWGRDEDSSEGEFF